MTDKYTREEQAILDEIARQRGQDWVDKNAELILDQARSYGVLPERSVDPNQLNF